EGIIAAHEQIEISGNPGLNGYVIAEDATSTSNTANENKISGNMSLTYNGLGGPFNSDKVQIVSWREVNE
ncbi:MAG: hypothetical protein QME44_05770, partial [Thermodesulfobacteriota bacterium]|nr:hypothetical protein [Thermodesulfobacteriota bacterium]